jgi:hypothetical protein
VYYVRTSRLPTLLEKAKVLIYEDLEAARSKRFQKEADKTSKNKRGQKRTGEAENACISGVVVDAVRSEAPEVATYAL